MSKQGSEPIGSVGVSLGQFKGRDVAELSIGGDRYFLDADQLDYLIHALIGMRRTIRRRDDRGEREP
ncbi:MAG TPA: hypothetical protein VHN56_07040 [Actinomycetota bacterium]|nr:hypothetical protein [Actinomycetota bacterium]